MERATNQPAEELPRGLANGVRQLWAISAQMVGFGPLLAASMSFRSTVCLPWGLGAAGAETVKQGVDSGNAEGVAHMTAAMVRLGMLGTVHDIVVTLCGQQRADAVASVTAGLLILGEHFTIIQITNALLASGHAGEALQITGHLLAQGNQQIRGVVSQTKLDLGQLVGGGGGGSQEQSEAGEGGGSSSQGIVQSVRQGAAKVLEKVTPGQSEEQKAPPNAEALFSEWTGVQPGEVARGGSPPPAAAGEAAVASKEDRLL